MVATEGETTADADAIVFVSTAEAEALIRDAAGVARRHDKNLDRAYLHRTLGPICELAEDMGPWTRLQRILGTGPS